MNPRWQILGAGKEGMAYFRPQDINQVPQRPSWAFWEARERQAPVAWFLPFEDAYRLPQKP